VDSGPYLNFKLLELIDSLPLEILWIGSWIGCKNFRDPVSVIALSLGYDPKTPSAQLSKELWAARCGNIAMAGNSPSPERRYCST
jgi:hypothetical protein